MKLHKSAWLAGLMGLSACLAAITPARSTAQETREGVEVLARGPLHEAYAVPLDAQPKESPPVPKAPPDPIEELPPDQKPEGDNVLWIPGYWAWDTEAADFLWISGFWREAPPGRRWVPGNWQKLDERGWRWMTGFWSLAEQQQVLYVPPPPESLERGATTAAPDQESDYIPGCWIWKETRHVWRPGFWLRHRPDWVWCPAYYVWAPAGCTFIEGYWDHPLHNRGLLFAPLRIDRRVIVRGWTYQPQYVIAADALLGALFVRPATHRYYFGDYFGVREQKAGYVAWLDYHPVRTLRDPNFNYYHFENRREARWEESLRGLYVARQKGEVLLPPRTLRLQTTAVERLTVQKRENVTINKTINLTNIKSVTMLTPLNRVTNAAGTPLAVLAHPVGATVKEIEARKVVKLQTVSVEQKKVVIEHTTKLREVSVQRKVIEERGRTLPPLKTGEPPRVIRLDLPKHVPSAPPKSPRKVVPPLPSHLETRPR